MKSIFLGRKILSWSEIKFSNRIAEDESEKKLRSFKDNKISTGNGAKNMFRDPSMKNDN